MLRRFSTRISWTSHRLSISSMQNNDKAQDLERSTKRIKHNHEIDPIAQTDLVDPGDDMRAESPPPARSMRKTDKPANLDIKPKTDAFQALMSRRPKAAQPVPKTPRTNQQPIIDPTNSRDGLGYYILDPAKYNQSRVISYDDNFVLIYDMFPKGTVHILLLPRDLRYTLVQPLEALSKDPDFLQLVRKKVAEVKPLVAAEMSRRIGQYSKTDQARKKAVAALEERAIEDPDFDPDSEEAQASLPPWRNWTKHIRVGVHARPSMNHLHIHLISEDFHSEWVKKKNHINSFNTRFFVNLDEFPLAKDDDRREGVGSTDGLLKGSMTCWRCGKDYGNKFTSLKAHLEDEFEVFKKE